MVRLDLDAIRAHSAQYARSCPVVLELCDEVERLRHEFDCAARVNTVANEIRAGEVERLTRERDEARALVRGVESEDGNFGLLEHIRRWDAEHS